MTGEDVILDNRVLVPPILSVPTVGELALGLLDTLTPRDGKHAVHYNSCQMLKNCFPAETLSTNQAKHHSHSVCMSVHKSVSIFPGLCAQSLSKNRLSTTHNYHDAASTGNAGLSLN